MKFLMIEISLQLVKRGKQNDFSSLERRRVYALFAQNPKCLFHVAG